MPGGVLSSSGSLGPRFPAFLGTTTPLRLPTYRLGSLRFSLAPRYSGPTLSSLSTVAVSFGWSSRGLLYPGPPCPSLRESRLDLPSSLASLVDACPALRPRWGSPAHRRSRRGMLPSEPAMPSAPHNGIPFRGSISRPTSLLLLAPYSDCSYARRTCYRPAERALAGWDFPAVLCQGTHWVAWTGFIELVCHSPRPGFCLARRRMNPASTFPWRQAGFNQRNS